MSRIIVFIVPKYISKGRFRKTDFFFFLDHPDQRTCIADSQKAYLGGTWLMTAKQATGSPRQCKLIFVFGRPIEIFLSNFVGAYFGFRLLNSIGAFSTRCGMELFTGS